MKIQVETTVAAPLARVWDCWTDPAHIVHWNFASADWHCPKASNDLRAGGTFSYTMASRDGAMSFDFGGVYEEVAEHQKITYALADGRRVEVAFAAGADGTRVMEIFDPENVHPADMQRAGWQAILDNFRRYVEQG